MSDIPNMIAECSLCGDQVILSLPSQSNYWSCQKCGTIQEPYKWSQTMKIYFEPNTNTQESQS